MAPFNTGRSNGTVVVASGQKLSVAIDCAGGWLAGIILPATLTSTALTFTVSVDGVTYVALTDTAGSAISYTVAASKALSFLLTVFGSWSFVILNFGSNEGADRTITYILRG